MTEGLIGQFYVLYDGRAYPEKILPYDDTDIEVQCMKSAGENRFFWPITEDICHYQYQDVLGIIPELRPVTSCARHLNIEQSVWDIIARKLND